MSQTSSVNILEYVFSDTLWHNLKLFGNSTGVTVRSVGGIAISVYIIPMATGSIEDILTDEYLDSLGIDPVEIGGLTYEISASSSEYIYAKAKEVGAKINVRVYGTIDPKEDLSVVVNNLNNLAADYQQHKSAINNPHGVTKAQVGLGSLPNATSSTISSNSNDVLATTMLTNAIYKALIAHQILTNNPHGVTKDQVELGNVSNFTIATNDEAINESINDKYMTPMSTYIAVKSWVPQALSVSPQTIVSGALASRDDNWLASDIDNGTELVSIVDNLSLAVNTGLSLAFADKGKIRITEKTNGIYTLRMPTDPQDGIHYLYADISTKGIITGYGTTTTEPYEGNVRDNHTGDFFNASECVMYDSSDVAILRVYIAKIYMLNAVIENVVSQPLGNIYHMPIATTLSLGERYVVPNPYIGKVKTTAMIEYPSHIWGESKWNDQMGVISSPMPSDEINNIVTQVGLMGYLACGAESGTPLGDNFISVTRPLRIKCVVEKLYR